MRTVISHDHPQIIICGCSVLSYELEEGASRGDNQQKLHLSHPNEDPLTNHTGWSPSSPHGDRNSVVI